MRQQIIEWMDHPDKDLHKQLKELINSGHTIQHVIITMRKTGEEEGQWPLLATIIYT